MDLRVPWLSVVLFLPVGGALVTALLPASADRAIKRVGLLWSVATFVASLGIYASFQPGTAGYQLVERTVWVRRWGISYHLGVDGISLFLVLLTTFLMPVCFLVSWNITNRVKQLVMVLFLTEAAVVGVFLALDLVLFYVFWEAVLVPMYLLIGVWGYERRIYATIKFFLFTLMGGLLMLVAIVVLYLEAGGQTFGLSELARTAATLPIVTQRWLFAAFAVAFAVKVPLFPLHTWLPDAHTEAPTAGSVILAGVLLKMGTYGFLRFAIPFFPAVAQEAAPYLIVASVIGILYGAAVSVVQTDLKRLVAYSSVSHLGYVVLGLFAFTLQAGQGATLQMINHGLSTGALFCLVGMLYERRHTRQIEGFGGLGSVVPVLAGCMLIASLASAGLPGLNGFVGEFLILLGTFRVDRLAAVLGTGGVVLGALYLLWAYQRTFHGPVLIEENRAIKDLNGREKAAVYPLLAAMLLIGIWPRPFLERIEPSVREALSGVSAEPQPASAPITHGGEG